MKFALIICFCISSSALQAKTFDVSQAEGILIGTFLKEKVSVLENGEEATQMMIKIDEELGLQSENFGMDEVIVHYPNKHKPSFIPGERIAVLLKSVDNRFWGLDPEVNSFKIVHYDGVPLLINPQKKQISLTRFEESVKLAKGKSLNVVRTFQPEFEGSPGRTPASAASSEDDPEESFPTIWLVITLAFLGALFRLQTPRKMK